MAGWFTINREGGQTSIQFDRDEIRSDTARAINRGREYLDERGQRLTSQQGSSSNYRDDGYGQPTHQQQSYQQPSYQGQTYDQGQSSYQSDHYGQPQYDRTQHGQQQYDRSQYSQQQYGQPQSSQSQYSQPQYGQPQYGQPQYRETDYQHGGQGYQDNYQNAPTEARGGVRYGVPYQNERNR